MSAPTGQPEPNNKPTILSAIEVVRAWNDQDFGLNLSQFMDEQPVLFGFLLNLSEEFEDEEHDQLVRAALVLREGFAQMTLPLRTISNAVIEDVTREVTEALEDQDAVADDEVMTREARSPYVYAEVRQFLHENMRQGLPADLVDRHNLMVVVDIMIGCFEEAIDLGDDQDPKQPQKEDHA